MSGCVRTAGKSRPDERDRFRDAIQGNETAESRAFLLAEQNLRVGVVNARFAKPLDVVTISRVIASGKPVLVIEDHAVIGGFGSAVLEFMERANIKGARLMRFGLPDKFIEHGRRDELFAKYNLTPGAICDVIMRERI